MNLSNAFPLHAKIRAFALSRLLASDAAIHSSTPGQFVSAFATYP